MDKVEIIERNKEKLRSHFKKYNIPMMIPFRSSLPSVNWGSGLVMAGNDGPTYTAVKISYEDWLEHTKIERYKDEFENLVND